MPISRRSLFPAAAGVLAAVMTFCASAAVEAQTKTDKKTAKYQDHPNNGQSCSQCRYFLAPKSCQLVAGDVSPTGWCSFFLEKT
jgi:hypothetical protein